MVGRAGPPVVVSFRISELGALKMAYIRSEPAMVPKEAVVETPASCGHMQVSNHGSSISPEKIDPKIVLSTPLGL